MAVLKRLIRVYWKHAPRIGKAFGLLSTGFLVLLFPLLVYSMWGTGNWNVMNSDVVLAVLLFLGGGVIVFYLPVVRMEGREIEDRLVEESWQQWPRRAPRFVRRTYRNRRHSYSQLSDGKEECHEARQAD